MISETIKIDNLKVITLNINSIYSIKKRAELKQFLNENNPHILLLSETKINSSIKIYFKGYNCIRTDRENNRGGGTAILIKRNITFSQNVINLNLSFEISSIKIPLSTQNNLYIFSIYNSTY